MKVTIEQVVHKNEWGGYSFFEIEMRGHGYIPIGPITIKYQVPDDFDPIKAEVAILEKKLAEVEDEAKAKVSVLRDRIASLLCIENSAEVTE